MGNSQQRSRSLSDNTLDSHMTKITQEETPRHMHSIRVNGKAQAPSTSFPRHPRLEASQSDSLPIVSRSKSDFSSSRDKVLIHEGWLTKRGETSKQLKKRYWKLYENGILKYSTKSSGSFKKYADLRRGIDDMSLKDENGFFVEVSGRHLIFYAETSKERDVWFAIIYQHYFEKGKEKVKLLARSSVDRDVEEEKDKFDIPKSPKSNFLDVIHEKYKGKYKNTKKKRERGSSFDSTKYNAKHNSTKPVRSHSEEPHPHRNGHKNGKKQSKEDERVIFHEEYIHQECDGKTCLSLERVRYVLKKYDLWRKKNKLRKIKGLGMYKYINNGLGEYYNNTHLLNDYNHLIEFHDNVFHHIYAYFDGECDFTSCVLMKRLHRDRDYYKDDEKRKEIYYNYEDEKEVNTQQILNKIHCYYRHAYDVGFRVKRSKLLSMQNSARKRSRWSTPSRASAVMQSLKKMNKTKSYTVDSNEAQNIIFSNDALSDNEEEGKDMNTIAEHDDDNDDNDDSVHLHSFEDEWALLEICGFVQQKRVNLRRLRGVQRMNINKFISKVGKSQRYHYWTQYDDDDDKCWQIEVKYDHFKEEMLSNALHTISLKQWQIMNEKANDHFNMKRSRKIRPNKYWAELYNLPKDSNASFSITISHLIAIMLHCNFDRAQREFAETFYRINANETDESLKCRHSNFFHFGRLLRELIECFGKKIYNKNIVFYHGMSDDMMFIESSMYFHAPLSTTTSIEVAIAYSNNNDTDYLLELVDDDSVLGMARYFDCCWLSDFGNESEKYFIGGYKPLKIHTVLDAVLGRNYINYLKALYIIDRIMTGYYFDNESDEIKQIIVHLLQTQIANDREEIQVKERLNTEFLNEVKQLNKVKSFDDEDTAAIESHRRKMSRRISETFPNAKSSSNPFGITMAEDVDDEEYDYFNEIPKYITKLVDYYCCNVTNVCIDWSNLTEGDTKGFQFCKKLLCHHQYQWVKLTIFVKLFPQLKELNVRNIKLSKRTIEDIYNFLLNAKKENKYLDLYRIEIFEADQEQYPISKCLEEYLDKFKDVGWNITFNPFEDEMCILKLY